MLHATPLRRDQEQGSVAGAPEHAGETAAIDVDCLQHLTTFADAHAAFVGNVCVPNGVVCVDADAVRNAVAEVSPHTSIRQGAVCSDVESGEPLPVRLGDDQRAVVGRHGHAIEKGNIIGYTSSRSIRCDQGDDSGAAIDVGVAPTVHDDLVPGLV